MAYESLWRAVISQAIDDACRTRPNLRCTNEDIAQAQTWLTEPNKDFEAVCGLANLDVDRVRAYARERIEAVREKVAA